jgi:hypothetical protein
MAAFAKSWRGNGGVISVRAGLPARIQKSARGEYRQWLRLANRRPRSFDPQRFSGALANHHRIEPKDKPAGPRRCRSLAETRPESDTPRA